MITDEELRKVKAFVFDVDGVLSMNTSSLDDDGNLVRTANVKDGFAIRSALISGFAMAVITGGNVERVRLRYKKLGVEYIYLDIIDKTECLNDFIQKTGIKADQILYMGDDLVDYYVMQQCGIPVCPNDASDEIKAISKYISLKKGGEGCVREVIEKVMIAQGKWFLTESLIKKAY